MTLVRLATGFGVFLVLAPAAQAAGTVARDSNAVTYTSSASDPNNERVVLSYENGASIVESDRGVDTSDCTEEEPTRASCEPAPKFVVKFLGSSDTLVVGAIGSMTVEAHGGAGNDRLDGGPNADALLGDAGNDTLEGKAGTDTYAAGDGDDVIRARDGVAEDVDCGAGRDTATLDVQDRPVGCEHQPDLDADGDGVQHDADCDDRNAAIRPGGTDTPGNGVDEDCSGADATPPPPPPLPPPAATSPPPDPAATGQPADAEPVLSAVRVSTPVLRGGRRATITLTASEPGRARLTFKRLGGTGRVTAGHLTSAVRAGTTKIRFTRRLSRGSRLRPGRYRVTVVLTSRSGVKSRPMTVVIRVVR